MTNTLIKSVDISYANNELILDVFLSDGVDIHINLPQNSESLRQWAAYGLKAHIQSIMPKLTSISEVESTLGSLIPPKIIPYTRRKVLNLTPLGLEKAVAKYLNISITEAQSRLKDKSIQELIQLRNHPDIFRILNGEELRKRKKERIPLPIKI